MTTPKEATREALPDLDKTRMLGYHQIRYVAGYPESYVKEYAAALLESERQAHAAEVERSRGDAERWHYVRHHWSNAQMHWNKDATNSLKSIVLTIKTAHWTSGADEIDSAIDAALVAAKGEAR